MTGGLLMRLAWIDYISAGSQLATLPRKRSSNMSRVLNTGVRPTATNLGISFLAAPPGDEFYGMLLTGFRSVAYNRRRRQVPSSSGERGPDPPTKGDAKNPYRDIHSCSRLV